MGLTDNPLFFYLFRYPVCQNFQKKYRFLYCTYNNTYYLISSILDGKSNRAVGEASFNI